MPLNLHGSTTSSLTRIELSNVLYIRVLPAGVEEFGSPSWACQAGAQSNLASQVLKASQAIPYSMFCMVSNRNRFEASLKLEPGTH